MADNPNDVRQLFKDLTRLFRSGPTIKRKARGSKIPKYTSAMEVFGKSQSNAYSNAMNAYGQFDRMSRYADFSEMEYEPLIACLTGDTVIYALEGNKTIKELSELYPNGEKFKVYCFDREKNQIISEYAHSPRKTKRSKIVRVNLSNGKHIRCTPDHKFLADVSGSNTWVEAQNLRPKQKLVSMSRDGVYVESIKELKGEQDVYDLTTEVHHNFFSEGVVVHNSALEIVSHETCAQDEKGDVLHIYSENSQVKKALTELFYDVVDVDTNLTGWVRNMCKYGDFFLFHDVGDAGLVNVFPIPVNQISREEGFDPNDPFSVRFRWAEMGNQVLENWQVSHFRLVGNDSFLPYGSSFLESARRIWRQLVLAEDAMLVYRVIRSPERRVFYIDVGNIPPEEVPSYIEKAKSVLRSSQVIDKGTGRVDLRYNPLSVDEDYIIPVRGGDSGTKVDTLAGGTNVTAIEDIEYLQSKLFAALKVPKAYLGYDEALSSKAGLAQEDIRFSRTINIIQRTVLSELNKMALLHLYAKGFEDDDLLDFDLSLSNPSSIAQQQKLELYRSKFEIANQSPEGMLSKQYIQKNILGLTPKEIIEIDVQRAKEAKLDMDVEQSASGGDEGLGGGGGGGDFFGGGEGGEGEEPETEETPEGGEEEGGGLFAAAGYNLSSKDDSLILNLGEDDDDSSENEEKGLPIKSSNRVDIEKRFKEKQRKAVSRRSKGLGTERDTMRGGSTYPLKGNDFGAKSDPNDTRFQSALRTGSEWSLKDSLMRNQSQLEEEENFHDSLTNFLDNKIVQHGKRTSEIDYILKSFKQSKNSSIDMDRETISNKSLLREQKSVDEEEIDLIIDDNEE